ncbi:MAG: hypothetical protein ACJ8AI_09455 [Rhodopila sp.]
MKLDAATTLMLNKMSFVKLIGSGGADTIYAGTTHQVVDRGTPGSVLIGSRGGYDTFRNTAAGLQGDVIRHFTANDAIDIKDMAFAGATLHTVPLRHGVEATVESDATKTTFDIMGGRMSGGFHLASDGTGGTLLLHNAAA